MYYYILKDNLLVSESKYPELDAINEEIAALHTGRVYLLNRINPLYSLKRRFISNHSLSFLNSEGLEILKNQDSDSCKLPQWILSKISEGSVVSINTMYPDWQDCLDFESPQKYRINIAGLGDVGGTLAVGLRLLGGNKISEIGLYDRDANKANRWYFECSQITSPCSYSSSNIEIPYPDIKCVDEDSVFDCDMFVFCVSTGVPPLNSGIKDVRMAQFDGNSKIIGAYAKKARDKHFKGIFAVVSDPVDLLCKSVFLESNKDSNGNFDFIGLAPEQIRGYGLGVMNARAAFYAKQMPEASNYANEGRVFGPHGTGLIVADSISHYNNDTSLCLTEKTITANMEIRSTGFKPYIAPALSSGSLSILATISGAWHYSTTFLGGVFMGSRNRLTHNGTELEKYDFPDALWERLESSYNNLRSLL